MEREEKGCGRRGVLSEGGPDDGVNKGSACSPQEMIMYQKVRAYTRAKREGGRESERGRDWEIEMGQTQFRGPSEYSNVLSAATWPWGLRRPRWEHSVATKHSLL